MSLRIVLTLLAALLPLTPVAAQDEKPVGEAELALLRSPEFKRRFAETSR